MSTRTKVLFLLLLLICCWVPSTLAAAIQLPARPSHYVVDLANLIDAATEQKINGYLQELEQKTTAQMVVLTIPSLEGKSLEEFSLHVAHDLWKLGQKGKDNGVLLLIASQDRKYRFEIGYGLEGILPDSFVGSLGRTYLVPFFRRGEYGQGVYAAVLAIAREIATDAGVTITGMPRLRNHPGRRVRQREPSLFSKIISMLFLGILVIMFIRNPRLFLMLFLFSSMGGRGGPWGGSGGFGGGSFGGGGGGFGGGGASGGW